MNTDLRKQIEEHFLEIIETQKLASQVLPEQIINAATLMAESLRAQGKILVCGNGGSACDAQHFVAELVNRYLTDREPYAAIALNAEIATLTSIANDYNYAQTFARQVKALGKKGDILFAISTSGASANILEALKMAKSMNLPVVLLTGKDGGQAKKLLGEDDVEIRVLDDVTPRIQEVHIVVIHCLCEALEKLLANPKVSGKEKIAKQ
jgi:phosphoheptose isomerase